MRDDFAIFILTHGRPNNQKTLEALLKSGYTGKWFLVVDDLDKTVGLYKNLYTDKIIVFDKNAAVNITDTGLTKPWIDFAVFARNAIESIANSSGYKYFGMFDDDILKFRHRYFEGEQLKSVDVCNMDEVLTAYIEYMEQGHIACTCFGASNNYIGGKKNQKLFTPDSNSLRLCFNSYIRNADYKVDWLPNMCEDRVTSIMSNMRGQVWQQLLFVQMDTAPFYGTVDGGNSSVYRSLDEFTKVFFPVVTNPDSNRVCEWKDKFITQVTEDNICGKIISERYQNEPF